MNTFDIFVFYSAKYGCLTIYYYYYYFFIYLFKKLCIV